MTFKNSPLLALMALICEPSAEAREAALMSFDQAIVPITPATAIEDRVGAVLRFHLHSLAQPESRTEPQAPSSVPQRLQTDLQATPRWRLNAPPPPEHLPQPRCAFNRYAPVLWLPPEVEMRRSVHFDTMTSIACEFGLPPNLLDAVITQESGYKSWAVSSAGAMGIMQIMPGTARLLGLANPFDPVANMRAGARYLRQQINRFGRVDLALAAYNAGPERRSLAAGYVPAIPETLNYVRTITTNWARLAQLVVETTDSKIRGNAAMMAVQASGYRSVELVRYDGLNAANPM